MLPSLSWCILPLVERRFNNLEEAELFAARMRSEGRVAEVFSESIPTLWGAAAMGNIRVVVLDRPNDEPEEEEPNPVADLAGRIFYGVLLALVLGTLGWVALETAAYLVKDGAWRAVLKVGFLASSLYTLAAWSLLLSSLFRKGRDPHSRLGLVVHALISATTVLVTVALLFTDFRLW